MDGLNLEQINNNIKYLERQKALAHKARDYETEKMYKNQLEKKIGLRDILIKSLEAKL